MIFAVVDLLSFHQMSHFQYSAVNFKRNWDIKWTRTIVTTVKANFITTTTRCAGNRLLKLVISQRNKYVIYRSVWHSFPHTGLPAGPVNKTVGGFHYLRGDDMSYTSHS